MRCCPWAAAACTEGVYMRSIFRRIRLAYVVLFVFLSLLMAGVLLGGFGEVMANGVMICLDCLGLF